jgi:heme/copper-type cytochrome/quinol oxidase subunit 2
MHSAYYFAQQGDPEKAAIIIFVLTLIAIVIIFALLMTILVVWSFCRIFRKAGYNWAWGLLWLVPIGNIVALLMLAFGDWPILKEMRQLKGSAGGGQGSGSNPTAK